MRFKIEADERGLGEVEIEMRSPGERRNAIRAYDALMDDFEQLGARVRNVLIQTLQAPS